MAGDIHDHLDDIGIEEVLRSRDRRAHRGHGHILSQQSGHLGDGVWRHERFIALQIDDDGIVVLPEARRGLGDAVRTRGMPGSGDAHRGTEGLGARLDALIVGGHYHPRRATLPARSNTCCNMGLPAMSRRGLPGSRDEP